MRLSRQAHDREICRRHFEAHLALWWNRALPPPFFLAVHNTPLCYASRVRNLMWRATGSHFPCRFMKQEPCRWNTSKALWRGPVVSWCGGLAVMAQEANSRIPLTVATHLLTSLNLPVSSLAPDSNSNPVTVYVTHGLVILRGVVFSGLGNEEWLQLWNISSIKAAKVRLETYTFTLYKTTHKPTEHMRSHKRINLSCSKAADIRAANLAIALWSFDVCEKLILSTQGKGKYIQNMIMVTVWRCPNREASAKLNSSILLE